MKRTFQIILSIIVCAFVSEAQTLTSAYVAMVDSADSYIAKGKWDLAEKSIINALRADPSNKSNYLLWSNLGMVRTNEGKYEEALQAYDIGLTLAPRSTTLLSNRAYTYLETGKADEALIDINKSLEIDSALQWPRRMRGKIMILKGKPELAIDDFNKYLSLHGEDADVLLDKGDAEEQLGLYTEAIADYEKARACDDSNPEAPKRILYLYHTMGKLNEKEPLLRDCLRRWPHDPELYLLRGALHRQRYQMEEAEADKKIAIKYGADAHSVELFFPKIKK